MKFFRFVIAALIAAVLVAQGDPTVGSLAAAMTIFGGPFLPQFSPPDDAGATPAEPPANGVATFTESQFKTFMDEFKGGIRSAVKDVIQEEQAAAPEKRGAVDVVDPDSIKVGARRDVDGEGWKLQQHYMFVGAASRDAGMVAEARALLARSGAFGEKFKKGLVAEGRALGASSTTGAPWLATQALARIDTIREEFGAARKVCNIWTGLDPVGTSRVPRISGRPSVFAVGEATNIKARNSTTGYADLTPKKWGIILGYSRETKEALAGQAVDKMIEQIGWSFTEAEDQTVFTADGTATYHSLTGILANTSATAVTLAATGTDFEDVTRDKIKELRQAPAAGVRRNGKYVFHPDMEGHFLDFQDGNGTYLFDQDAEVTRMLGRDVVYSEALPADSDSAVSTYFGCFGDFSYVHMGFADSGIEMKMLDQATILDPADDSTLIHLALSDQEAIRFIARWDVDANFVANVAARIKTAAS